MRYTIRHESKAAMSIAEFMADTQERQDIEECQSCGSLLCVSPDMERFACKRCAAEQIVVRQGGTTVLKRVDGVI
jgi:predicted RNA-binding Zn-ribbon protein involved in translation (DUF1610 family)